MSKYGWIINKDYSYCESKTGDDVNIMGPRGSKTPWSDARVAREELEKALGK